MLNPPARVRVLTAHTDQRGIGRPWRAKYALLEQRQVHVLREEWVGLHLFRAACPQPAGCVPLKETPQHPHHLGGERIGRVLQSGRKLYGRGERVLVELLLIPDGGWIDLTLA